ncbi:MAG TPA: right-handed parallel beta-helix repeat-containing protein [Lysobacter sp.]
MTSFRKWIASGAFGLLAITGIVRAESFDTCAGFIDSLPATVGTQGTWCLRHDLSTAIASGFAIEVTTNNVTIECNGFKIGGLAAGPGSQTYGIYAHSRLNVSVRNCTVRGFYYGIYLFGSGFQVEDNRFDHNLWKSIGVFGDASRVMRNLVVDTGGGTGVSTAIAIHASADVIGNAIHNVYGNDALANTAGTGIEIYSGRGNVVRDNNISGLLSAGSGAVKGIRVDVATATVIDHNNMSRTGALGGNGILVDGMNAFCNNNTIYNFATPLTGCTASSGNQALP